MDNERKRFDAHTLHELLVELGYADGAILDRMHEALRDFVRTRAELATARDVVNALAVPALPSAPEKPSHHERRARHERRAFGGPVVRCTCTHARWHHKDETGQCDLCACATFAAQDMAALPLLPEPPSPSEASVAVVVAPRMCACGHPRYSHARSAGHCLAITVERDSDGVTGRAYRTGQRVRCACKAYAPAVAATVPAT